MNKSAGDGIPSQYCKAHEEASYSDAQSVKKYLRFEQKDTKKSYPMSSSVGLVLNDATDAVESVRYAPEKNP